MRIPLLLAFVMALPASRAFAQLDSAEGPAIGRVLWMKAEDGVAKDVASLTTLWGDQSGTGNDLFGLDGRWAPRFDHVSPSRMPSLHFDGNDVLFRTTGMPVQDYTKVMVFELDDYAANNNVLSGNGNHAVFYGFSDRAQIFHNGTFVISDTPTPLGETTVLVATYDASSGVGTLYQNGQLVGTGIGSPNTDPSIQVGAFALGNNLRGSVYELMIFDRVLGIAEQQGLEARLGQKYQTQRLPTHTLDLPAHGCLLQRDLITNQAPLPISGTVVRSRYSSVQLEITRDEAPWLTVDQPLRYEATGSASFSLSPPITSGLWNYDFELFLTRGSERILLARRENVVCGDMYLMNGQSNAVAGDYWTENLSNQDQDPFIRSFGDAIVDGSAIFDQHWALGNGQTFNSHGSIGSWGLRMAKILTETEGIPIAILNGAVGGTSITLHQRNHFDPDDVSTIYGRLLHRAQASGIAKGARAMLWYQGESDGEQDQLWSDQFNTLRQAWAIDYPALEHQYVVQIRKGCGVTFAGVRDVQRRLPEVYPDLSVMSTTGLPVHDGCHYFFNGYKELGIRFARLLRRDLYQSGDPSLDDNIEAPRVASAAFSNGFRNLIEVTFEPVGDSLVWEPGSESFFSLSDGISVIGGSASGNTVTLALSSSSQPGTALSYDGHAFDGPWITNNKGVGILTFFDIPIQD